MGKLLDGQSRTMRPSPWFNELPFKVIAERIDDETPLIHIQTDGYLALTDSEAVELIKQLQRALSVLPSSK